MEITFQLNFEKHFKRRNVGNQWKTAAALDAKCKIRKIAMKKKTFKDRSKNHNI